MQDPIPAEAGKPFGPVWAAIVAACETWGITGQQADDVAFHMTDSMDDFRWLQRFFTNPTEFDPSDAGARLFQILSHMPNHAAAAAMLYTGEPVRDVFGIRAVREETHDERGQEQ